MLNRFIIILSMAFSLVGLAVEDSHEQRGNSSEGVLEQDELEKPVESSIKDNDPLLKSLENAIKAQGTFEKAVQSPDFQKSLVKLIVKDMEAIECGEEKKPAPDATEKRAETGDSGSETSSSSNHAQEDDDEQYVLKNSNKRFEKILREFSITGGIEILKAGFQQVETMERIQFLELVQGLDECIQSDDFFYFSNSRHSMYPPELRIKDFKNLVKYIDANKKKIIFSSETHEYGIEDEKLASAVQFAGHFFLGFGPRALDRKNSPESKLMDDDFRRWIVRDSKTADLLARSDVVDILGHEVGKSLHLHPIRNNANTLGVMAVKSYFDKAEHPATFTALAGTTRGQGSSGYEGRGSDSRSHEDSSTSGGPAREGQASTAGESDDEDEGEEEYDYSGYFGNIIGDYVAMTCLGGPLTLDEPTEKELKMMGIRSGETTSAAGESFVFQRDQAYEILESLGYEKISFRCGKESLSLAVKDLKLEKSKDHSGQEKPKKVELKDPSDRHFSFGADKKIQATMTVGLVDETDPMLLAGLSMYMRTKGYTLKEKAPVKNLKSEFSEALKTTDLYMPVGHAISVSDFVLGADRGERLVFEKKVEGDRTIELTVFVPPTKGVNKNSVSLSGPEASEALVQRYKQGIDPPFIVNISCDSGHTAKGWTYAHGVAQERLGCVGAGESPVVLGADRGFGTGDAKEIASHLDHPLAALSVAEKEGSAKELFKALEQTGYSPVANFGKNSHRSGVKDGEPQVIKFTNSEGKELLF